MRESSVESVLVQGAKAKGGIAFKIQPTIAGVPDRVVLLPGGRAFLVELKQAGAQPSKIQQEQHRKLAQIGHDVVVLRGADRVREWVSTL